MGKLFMFEFLVLLGLLVFPVVKLGRDEPIVSGGDMAVHGGWNAWSGWSSCSATCGSTATHRRQRYCSNPTPRHCGRYCLGSAHDEDFCEGHPQCPIHGDWTAWSSWSACSATCDSTTTYRRRQRMCSNPSPTNGGRDCLGSGMEDTNCVGLTLCPAVECENLSAPENGLIHVGGQEEGAKTSYTCNDGYNLIGTTNVRICLSGFIWSETVPTCEPLARYVCDDGFSVYNVTANRLCGMDGNWNGTDIILGKMEY